MLVPSDPQGSGPGPGPRPGLGPSPRAFVVFMLAAAITHVVVIGLWPGWLPVLALAVVAAITAHQWPRVRAAAAGVASSASTWALLAVLIVGV